MNKKRAAELAADYSEYANKLAVIIGQLQEIQTHCEYLKNESGDNGDPYYDLQPVLERAGIALASMVVYATEYKEEAMKGDGKTE